jgi:excisionase family DNA binding protein
MERTSKLSVREAALQLRCTLKFIYDLLWAGRLQGAQKVGRTRRIPVEAVEARIRHDGARKEERFQSRGRTLGRKET